MTENLRVRRHVGLGIVVVAAVLLAAIATHVLSDNSMTALDMRLANYFDGHGSAGWTRVLLLITHAHSGVAIVLFSLLFCALLARRRDWFWLLAVAGTTFGGMLLNQVLKYSIRRERPSFENPLLHLTTYSFPSGHTVGATLLYGVLAAFLMSRVACAGIRMLIVVCAMLMVVVVAFSRLYLGAHYLSDVVAAAIEGVGWLALCLTLVAALAQRYPGLRSLPSELRK